MASKFIGDIQAGELSASGIASFAGAIKVTETGTAQQILIGNQDSGGTNRPGMIRGVNGSVKLGYGNSWSGEGGTMTELLSVNTANVDINTNLNVNGFVAAEGFSVQNSGGALSLMNPQGAQYATQTSSVTGAITVRLPVSWTNTMMRMQVRIYEYSTNESFDVVIGGYNYGSTSTWINTFAYILGDPDSNRSFTVRFGYNTTLGKCEIYIGETTSTWSYPQVVVTNFEAGYSNYAAETWNDGWDIVFSTAFGTVTATHASTQVGRYIDGNQIWHAGNDGAGSGLDADLLDGVQGSSYARTDIEETFDGNVNIKGDLKMNGTDSYIWTPGTGSGYTGFYDPSGGGVALNYNESFDGWGVMQSAKSGYALAVNGKGEFKASNQPLQITGTAAGAWVDYVGATGTMFSLGRSNDTSFALYNRTNPLYLCSWDTVGNMTATGDVTAYSDERLKENIVEISDAMSKVEKLRGVTFTRKNTGEASTGLVAQDVQAVLPEAVKEMEDGYLSVKYGNMVGLLVEGMKEMKATIDAQAAKITELENKLNGK